MNNILSFDEFLNEDVNKQLTQDEYKKWYPVIGRGGAGLQFNFNGSTVGGYVVPEGESLQDLIDKIEKASKKKLTAVPYDQKRKAQVSGTMAGWVDSGTEIWLQILKK